MRTLLSMLSVAVGLIADATAQTAQTAGTLEWHPIWIEAPRELIDEVPVPSEQPEWRFRGYTDVQTERYLQSLGLDDRLLNRLFLESRTYIYPAEVRMHPTVEALVELPRTARSQLYTFLRELAVSGQRELLVFHGLSVAEFFDGRLPADTIRLIEKLIWDYQGVPVFSDIEVLLGRLPDGMTEKDLLQLLSRRRSYIGQLRIDSSSDIETLARYWTQGYKQKDVSQLFQSVAIASSVERIDLAHLLPPFPRQNLYTYPAVSSAISGDYPDAFATAFNFFRGEDPVAIRSGSSEVRQHLSEHYQPVERSPRYGDLVLFEDQEFGDPIHSAIYLAEDYLYTKNSKSPMYPWIISRKTDVQQGLFRSGKVRASYWETKTGSSSIP